MSKKINAVNAPFGERPFLLHYDSAEDGANIGFAVLDRLRAQMLHRVGFGDLLKPARPDIGELAGGLFATCGA